MNRELIAWQRLYNQQIIDSRCRSVVEVVSWLGAMQAQDYPGALWAIGLRLPGSKLADIEKAIARREIIRTWPMRGTLHFVAATDIRWMLELLNYRIVGKINARDQALELTEKVYQRSRDIFTAALQGDKQLRRDEMLQSLEKGGIKTNGQRGYHILCRLAQEGLICFGSHDGKQPTFALLSEWAPTAKSLSREESLAAIAQKFFHSHGPATVADFARWTGLNLTDARFGLEAIKGSLVSEKVDGIDYYLPEIIEVDNQNVTQLLPGFDEYMLGYKDRSAALVELHAQKIVPGNNGMFLPTIVIDGQVVGLWKRTIGAKSVKINLLPFEKLTGKDLEAIKKAAKRYGDFLGLSANIG
ncbi:MAG TPA: winged helix DNA-binding domain-containing protein [Candidatus Saccharimonadales bacterium]|jgi:hypothetical protein|nr:winged helix DNA-binding domain-containing protein [Candidatus Saccharimonadales bacterium]